MLSFWLDGILNSFLVEKCTHDRFSRQKKIPASFLLVFAEKLGRVYEALDLSRILTSFLCVHTVKTKSPRSQTR